MLNETDAALVQGSPAWHNARLGKITCSRFKDILTQPRSKADREAGNLSVTAKMYMMDVVAEILTGQSQEAPTTKAMQWGLDNEPAARQLYAERTGHDVRQVGFYEHPSEPRFGGSPDGLIDMPGMPGGGVEIKCPFNTAIHLGYILGGVLPKEHEAQVYGHLWLTGRTWWDFVTYDPRINDLSLAFWRLRVWHKDVINRVDEINDKVRAFREKVLETLCELKGARRE